MSLYLCVFDGDRELEGVDLGGYSDYGSFLDLITNRLENGEPGSKYPILVLHSDCDGSWSADECPALRKELSDIAVRLKAMAPLEYEPSSWQASLTKLLGSRPNSLCEFFIDVDGEPLVERLMMLCDVAQRSGQPILLQ